MEGYRMIGFDEFGLEKFRHYRYCRCDICGRKTAVKSNFCPNCGADMRKDDFKTAIAKEIGCNPEDIKQIIP